MSYKVKNFAKIQPETDNHDESNLQIVDKKMQFCSYYLEEEKGKQITNVFDIFDYHLGTYINPAKQLEMEQKCFLKHKS